MDKAERVQDDEELYRNVRGGADSGEYFYDTVGKLRIQPEAFRDRSKKPSVDRAKLLDFDPSRALLPKTNLEKANGIVSLMASDVRAITDVITKTEEEIVVHAIDVVPVPTDDRPAHAEITVDPDYFGSRNKQRNTFKDLQKALARRASDIAAENGWTLPPKE